MSLGLFYPCLKLCNIKSFLSLLVAMFLCMRGRELGLGLLPLLVTPTEIQIKGGKISPSFQQPGSAKAGMHCQHGEVILQDAEMFSPVD